MCECFKVLSSFLSFSIPHSYPVPHTRQQRLSLNPETVFLASFAISETCCGFRNDSITTFFTVPLNSPFAYFLCFNHPWRVSTLNLRGIFEILQFCKQAPFSSTEAKREAFQVRIGLLPKFCCNHLLVDKWHGFLCFDHIYAISGKKFTKMHFTDSQKVIIMEYNFF